jgi:tRNA pseudouridine55 synthase
MYSAVKYAGKPLYSYARAGKVVDRSPKEISVFEFQITRYENPEADFRVRCTKGTYVRSLVHDLGQVLGCGAVLKNLRRTAIGPFNVGSAFRLDALVALRNRLQENTSSHASRTTAA